MSEETAITFHRVPGTPEPEEIEDNTPSITIKEQIGSLLIVLGTVGALVLGSFAFGWKYAGFGFCVFWIILGLALAYTPTTPATSGDE